MHNSYYFIKQVSKSLEKELVGLELATCFSQNRDELVLGFCNPQKEFWMKASLQPDLCLLVFPDEFHRAKRNSVDLFQNILDHKVQSIRQFENERAFSIEFENDWKLCFKMYGNRANVVLFKGNDATSLFRKKFEKDAQTPYNELDRPIPQSLEFFQSEGLKKTFPTFDKTTKRFLSQKGFDDAQSEGQWQIIEETLAYLDKPQYYIYEKNGRPRLSLFDEGIEPVFQTKDALQAANEFFYRFSKVYFTEKEKQRVMKSLQHRIKQGENYIDKNKKRLDELLNSSRYEETGHIIMANLHQIPERAEEVTLHDFYNDKPIKIKLKPRLSPQKNAERLYRKAKNQKVEVKQLKENINAKESQIFALEMHLEEVEKLETFRELTKYQKQHGLKSAEEEQEASLPFKRFEFMGFEMLVGKNSKANDELIQRYAYKEDLWLHARDVTGSHVIVKYQAGKAFPKPVIEKAASLAAYYSQGKHNSLQPVIVTPKKFVRKVKGAAAGQVMVDKEEVLMIEPKSFDEEL